MKTNKANKIEEYFQEIKAESVFKALKQKKYKGVKRSEIDHLLKKISLERKKEKTNSLFMLAVGIISIGLFSFSFM